MFPARQPRHPAWVLPLGADPSALMLRQRWLPDARSSTAVCLVLGGMVQVLSCVCT